MSAHIVAAFRSLETGRPADEYLDAIRALTQQAAAMGGRLLTFSASVCTFEFDTESVVDAIELAISVALDSVPGMTFGVGISEGPLARASDATVGAPLAWGPSLVRAVALSRSARQGEVLIDPGLRAARSGELLGQGARSLLHGKERLRALLLDIRHPFRSALAGSVASLERPRFVGRSELGELLISAGSLGIVRAAPGAGGSRFLDELGGALEPARILLVTPHPMGEPLGALRRSMLRAVTLGHAPLAFGEQVGQSLDSLLAGEGLDIDSAAELLATWLTPDSAHDPSGVLLLDDADCIERDTLDSIAAAARMTQEPFRVIARLDRSDPIPAALRGLPVATEVSLGPLQSRDAAALVASCLRGQIDERLAERWAERGGGMPLGLVESIYEALESGSLVWEDEVVSARLSRTGSRERLPPKRWIEQRLRTMGAEPRLIATALCVLGGEAEVRDLHELVEHRTDASFDLAPGRAALEAAGWVAKVKPDMLALTSATHRGVVLAMLEEEDLAAWHRSACEVLRRRSRPLAVASRAVHAALAGDLALAAELAGRAANAARAVGLEEAAGVFSALAEEESLERIVERRLLLPHMVLARELPSLAPSETVVLAATDAAARPAPVEVADDDDDAEDLPPDSIVLLESEAPPSSRLSPIPEERRSGPTPEREEPSSEPSDEDRISTLELDEDEIVDVSAEGAGDEALSEASPDDRSVLVHEEMPADRSDTDRSGSGALLALKAGDLEAVEAIAARLRVDESRAPLADRLTAMASLARGETGEALRRLRSAAELARSRGSPDQCRAQLALAIGLARAERQDEALLAVLTGLARARERKDGRGEQACIRFIAQLSGAADGERSAGAWKALIR